MVGNGGEDGVKYGGNGVGAGYDVQVSHTVGVVICERQLGGDRVHAQSYGALPSSDRKKDYRDDGAVYNKLGVSPSG